MTLLPGCRYGGLFAERGVWAVDEILDFDGFRELFQDRAVVFTDLPAGRAREVAERVNERAGRGDATIRTPAEFEALFGELTGAGQAARLTVRDGVGVLTAEGAILREYLRVAGGADNFFDQPMWVVSVADWPAPEVLLEKAVTSSGRARLDVWRADPADPRPIPPAGASGVLFTSATFSLMNSGNRTLLAPKRSWKIDVEPGDDDDKIVGLARLNLKSMYNDPSQMREALAWDLFARTGIPAARHTYARLAINGGYRGLYSMIEQVDRSFLRTHFGENNRGNLYKAYCGDVGCATLEHRADAAGDDSGKQYFTPGHEDLTYRLKTNEDDAKSNTYDDLAALIRTINGVGLPGGGDRFDSDAFHGAVRDVLDVQSFLRWAGANVLLGSWDNYFATPANYYLYNGGLPGKPMKYLTTPYFTFIPWDYDNSFGIDYSGTAWQYTDLLDWPGNTAKYWHRDGHPDRTSRIPLVQNILANHDFAQYYLDHLEYLLDTAFTPAAVAERMGTADGNGLWQRINRAAYLEADTPYSTPFTGRQFTNDEVYRAGYAQEHLQHGNSSIEGIYHFVRMRYESARTQLHALRATYPAGASGAHFWAAPQPVTAGV